MRLHRFFPHNLPVALILFFAVQTFVPSSTTAVAQPSLFFHSTASTVSIGDTVSVDVLVASPDTAMNTVSATVVYPSNVLVPVSVSKEGSRFPLWVDEPVLSTATGTIHFAAVLLNPGFKGNAGQVLRLQFRARAAGIAMLTLRDVLVLANDGVGTSIPTSAHALRFMVVARGTTGVSRGTVAAAATPTSSNQNPIVAATPTTPYQNPVAVATPTPIAKRETKTAYDAWVYIALNIGLIATLIGRRVARLG